MTVEVEHVASPTADARTLIEELDGELSGQYPPEQRHGFSVDRVFQPDVRFFVARLDGDAVGCGGVAFDDGFAEVKRMYVRPRARGRQVADAILARLETEARESFLTRLRDTAQDAFLEAYFESVASARARNTALLDFFLIEKAAYEVAYEAANRPAWLPIPLNGLARLAERILRVGSRAAS